MMNQAPHEGTHAQGGGYGPPPGGYGPPGGGAPPGGYGPPGGAPPGGYGPPGGAPPGGYGGPPGGAPPPAYGPPPGGAPMPPPGGGPMPGGPPMMGGDAEALKKQMNTWMIVGVVTGFCLSGCIGWVGALLAYLGTQSLQRGDMADAQSKLKIAKILVIVGIALGVVGFGLYGVMIAVSQF